MTAASIAYARDYATTVSRGRLNQATMDKRVGLFKGALDYSALADADLIIEAVFEEIWLKQEIFEELDAIAKPSANARDRRVGPRHRPDCRRH